MICFHIVSLHLPDRVLRQFGYTQHVPDDHWHVDQLDPRGRVHADWHEILIHEILQWNMRHQYIVAERYPHALLQDYLSWYWRITRSFILTECRHVFTYVHHEAIERELVQSIFEVNDITREVISGRDEPLSGILSIVNVVKRVLGQHPFRRPDAPRVPLITYTRR